MQSSFARLLFFLSLPLVFHGVFGYRLFRLSGLDTGFVV
jgi:hypothetical protein